MKEEEVLIVPAINNINIELCEITSFIIIL